MDNKELNMESEKTILDEENLKDINGGTWKEDARISEKVWNQMSAYERYTYNTLSERTENSLAANNIREARWYFNELLGLQKEMNRKYYLNS